MAVDLHSFIEGLGFKEVTCLLHSIDASLSSSHPSVSSLNLALNNSWTALQVQLTAAASPSQTGPPETKRTHLEDEAEPSILSVEGKGSECSEHSGKDSTFWAQVAVDHSWEQLHTGYWQDVRPAWRQAFALGTLLKALNSALKGNKDEAMAELDRGLLLGVPIMDNALQRLVNLLMTDRVSAKKIGRVKFRNYMPSNANSVQPTETERECESSNSDHMTCDVSQVPLIDMARRIHVEYCPTLVEFKERHMMASAPVVVTGAMDHWPAYTEKKWRYYMQAGLQHWMHTPFLL